MAGDLNYRAWRKLLCMFPEHMLTFRLRNYILQEQYER